MSLILEALKKLEREKQLPQRGFLVVAQSGAEAGRAPRFRLLLLAAGLALGTAVAWGAWHLSRRPGPAAAPVAQEPVAPSAPPAASAAPAASTAALPSTAAPEPPPVEATATHLPAAAPPVRVDPLPAAPPAGSGAARPRGVPRAAARELRLEAVSEQDGMPVAVLSGRLVRVGDSFEGVRVISIGADHVEVEVKGRRRLVTF